MNLKWKRSGAVKKRVNDSTEVNTTVDKRLYKGFRYQEKKALSSMCCFSKKKCFHSFERPKGRFYICKVLQAPYAIIILDIIPWSVQYCMF